jgi:hypothetical protein
LWNPEVTASLAPLSPELEIRVRDKRCPLGLQKKGLPLENL